MSQNEQLLRIMAPLDGHFRAEDCSPADADRWRELRWRVNRMRDALTLIEVTLREERVRGIAFTPETGLKLARH